MIKLYDDINLITHIIDLKQLKRITKKDYSSGGSVNYYTYVLFYKDGDTLEMVLNDVDSLAFEAEAAGV